MQLSTSLLLLIATPFLLVLILLIMLAARLDQLKGGRLRKRTYYFLGLSLFFTLMIFGYGDKDITVFIKGIVFGSILCLPFYYLTKRDMEKRIKGNVIYYKQRNLFEVKRILLLTFISIITQMLLKNDIGRQILITNGVMLGFGFAWFFSLIFILIYIAKLERKLGTSIVEDIEGKQM